MPDYRRFRVQGGTYFFTVVTCNRLSISVNHTSCLIGAELPSS